jgi:hypothetical protein
MPNSAGSEPAAAPETPPPAETTIEHERENAARAA